MEDAKPQLQTQQRFWWDAAPSGHETPGVQGAATGQCAAKRGQTQSLKARGVKHKVSSSPRPGVSPVMLFTVPRPRRVCTHG